MNGCDGMTSSIARPTNEYTPTKRYAEWLCEFVRMKKEKYDKWSEKVGEFKRK